jgi:hypothetical protein
MATNPAPDPPANPAPDPAAGPAPQPQLPVAATPPPMTPHAVAVALFAALVVGGILGRAVPLWAVVLVGLAVGIAVFVLLDRYPRLPGRGWTRRS